MEELWRKSSEMLGARPLLWLPVLVADLLGFFATIGGNALVQTLVLDKFQYHSVLGGPVVSTPLTPALVRHANITAAAVTLPSDFVRLLLYTLAFLATAALVLAYVRRDEKPANAIVPALGSHVGSIFSLSLRALAIYGGMLLLTGWLSESLIAHGHKAAIISGWPELGMGLIRVALLAWLLAPEAVHVLARRQPTGERRNAVRIFAFALGTIALLLGRFVTQNVRSVHIASAPVRTLLELTGSWIVALPYAVFFVYAAFVALKTMGEADFEAS